MTKEERIKEAWGELMPDYTSINLYDGWSLGFFNKQEIDCDKFDSIFYKIGFFIRPKSLQGIEDNNGWVKVESEDDLPKENGVYFIKDKFRNTIYTQSFEEQLSNNWLEVVTHYQPIIKPKPPLY